MNGSGSVTYAGGLSADTGRMPSGAVWAQCPWDLLKNGAMDGHVYWNDFTGNYALAYNNTATNLGSDVMGCTDGTAGSTLTMETDEPYGVISLNCTTDNEDVGISVLGGSNTAGQIVFSSGKQTWFEARIKRTLITDSKSTIFCGFAEEALLVNGSLVTTSDALADKDYVGFTALFADGDALDIVYNTASGGTSPVTHLADAATLAADTYVKVGAWCDGEHVRFYVNGVKVGTDLALTATDFPDGEEMAFYYVMGLGHGDDAACQIDWVRIAQKR